MAKKIKPTDFSKALSDLVSGFQADVLLIVDQCVDDVAKESSERLKTAGSFGGSGAYKQDWDWKVINSKRLTHDAVAYNEEHYRLSHLLEFGHAKQNGGRTRAFEHIAPVNDWAQKEIVDRIKRKVEGL
jgi:hypothetical protein